MQQRSCWGDLPRDILVLILNKLRFVDQVRFSAVCENWRIPKSSYTIKCSDRLPWALKYSFTKSRDKKTERYRLTCDLFDPYSQKVYKVSKYIKDGKSLKYSSDQPELYASRYGWLLFGFSGDTSLLFLHNPFTNEVIMLPHLELACKAATFTMDPKSPHCEILVLGRLDSYHDSCFHAMYVGRCCLSRAKKEWNVNTTEPIIDEVPLNVCYVNGELYCLFPYGVLKSYNIGKESWRLVTRRWWLPEPSWLIENENGLLLAHEESRRIFPFTINWSKMRWVEEANLDKAKSFVSRHVSLSGPLEDRSVAEFFRGGKGVAQRYHDGWNFRYFWEKGRLFQLIENSPRDNMSFIQPPYV